MTLPTNTYICDDASGNRELIDAPTARAAFEEYKQRCRTKRSHVTFAYGSAMGADLSADDWERDQVSGYVNYAD